MHLRCLYATIALPCDFLDIYVHRLYTKIIDSKQLCSMCVYICMHKEQILVYHHRVSADGRFMMASFSENMCIYDILFFHTHIYFQKRHDSSQISKKQICLLFLLFATAVRQMVKLEMFVVVMRLFPFDQDATSIKDIQ